jgi:hypothetical protein
MSSAGDKISVILDGIGAGFLTFVGVDAAAFVVVVVIRLVDKYTGRVQPGSEWTGLVFFYWTQFLAAFLGLIVCARVCKSRWHG